MPNQQAPQLNGVFHSLADPTRRAVLERLSQGPAAVSDLAEPFGMSLPSFLQHLSVLERSGLVKSQKEGRVRTYELTPRPLEVAQGWLEQQRTLWNQRFDQLDAYLTELNKKEQRNK